jgi:hypothetical protein
MAKIIIFPTAPGAQGRRQAAERAVQIQRTLGGHIISRPFRGRAKNDPNGNGPEAA